MRNHAPPLVLDGVTKRFGTRTAVDQVSLQIEEGEIFALLGPNGAGKTTLISCVTGLARATSGRIEVFGHDVVRAYRSTRRWVGLVPQEINFDPFFTPRESLLNQMGFMGCPPDPEWVDELLRTFALYDRREAYTRSLSGGMKRRLLVAKALVHRPRLLFLDEPTAGVDVQLRQDLWTEVLRLKREGTTIILTTHYLEEAQQLADRIGMIRDGRLLVVDDRANLMNRHHEAAKVRLTLAGPLSRVPEGVQGVLSTPTELEAAWHTAEELERVIARVRNHVDIVDLQVRQVTLEDVFLQMMAPGQHGPAADSSPGASS
jgi:ABC-2 type transport system ATP-binding protein